MSTAGRISRCSGTCSLLLALVVAAGCSTTPPPQQPSGDPGPKPTPVTEQQTPPELPQSVSEAILPPISLALEEPRSPLEDRFDVIVKRVPAREFFISLVKDTPYNVALSPGIQGTITLSMTNVTIEEVLATVSDVYGYEYRRTSIGFTILPAGLRSRIFVVDYLNLQRQGESQTQIANGSLADSAQDRNTTESGDSQASSGEGGGSGHSGSRIITQSNTDLWKELSDSVRTILGGREGRSVVVSANTGLLVVRASLSELRQVEEFLAAAQRAMKRLVIIEAKILEVRLDSGFQSGVNWAVMASTDKGDLVLGQVGGGDVISKGVSEIAGKSIDLGPKLSDLMTGTATSAFGGVFTAAIAADNFSMFIELLESQGDVRTLSNPRISTVNNQKAVIKVGSDEFFVTDVSTTTVTGTATTSTPNVTLTPFFSGIVLDVTPQISEDNHVILHIHPAVTLVEEQTKKITLDESSLELPLAFSLVRESDSIVRAMSGQVVVIGGLMRNHETDMHAGIPWLKDIPYLGKLFQHVRMTARKSELVILLRPVIVDHTGFSAQVETIGERMQKLLGNPEESQGVIGWDEWISHPVKGGS